MTAREKPPPDPAPVSSRLRADAVLDLAVDSKEALLRALAEVVIPDASSREIERIYEGIIERESAVNTYVGEGVAIPHARVIGIDGIHLALAKNPEGFPYGVATDQPVRIVVLVVGEESLHDEHVRVLGEIASVLKHDEIRRKILETPDPAAVIGLLDYSHEEPARQKARPLSLLLVTHARRIAREMGVTAIIVSTENRDELSMLRRIPGRSEFIVASSSRRLLDDAEKIVKRVLLLPRVPLRRDARVRLAGLMALNQRLIQRGDKLAVLSGDGAGGLDSITVLETGREFGRFVTASGEMAPDLSPGVLERMITLATDLAREGREGKPVGTIFVVGDPDVLAPYSQQMVMNPFRGYPEDERNVLDPTLEETIKEFASIDGAFIVRGDGVVISAGTYLQVPVDVKLPGGYGSRHRVACGITDVTSAISVAISQSTGEVTVFKKGAIVLSLSRSSDR
jgi:DNA integrity scanning protein DisA with diadenylate cyclase activity/mannitol/fructose-specific phosphotransferase system IIA component (Ntr-type)